jgi:hypothetical protein
MSEDLRSILEQREAAYGLDLETLAAEAIQEPANDAQLREAPEGPSSSWIRTVPRRRSAPLPARS